ncbi:MAG TPA: hypothetical protein VLM89_12520 [Phycisphaerae bacterium]|nr:hypothetical protein [Phycisphaerae bacterium]
MDAAILLRPEKCPTLEAIGGRFDLAGRYGISPAALRSYARRLEEFARPAMTSQVLAGVLGCLPAGHRRRVLTGSQVLLLSKVVKLLTDGRGDAELSVADLAKLATVLGSLAGRRTTSSNAKTPGGSQRTLRTAPAETAAIQDATSLTEAVRLVYGLTGSRIGREIPQEAPSTISTDE